MLKVKVGRPVMDLVKLCYKADLPLLLVGTHGIGKSEALEGAAKELNIDYICRDLSLMEPPDLVGLPKAEGSVTKYLPPSFLPSAGKGLLVFEELNRCERFMRGPCLQLLTARCLNDYVLPPGWVPAAAINPPEEGYDVQELDTALMSRFVVMQVEADQQEWLAWARSHNIHPGVTEYVASDVEIFDNSKSTPRAWKYVSDLLKAKGQAQVSKEALRVALAGLLGNKRAAAFLSFLGTRVRPVTVEEILSNYDCHRADIQGWIQAGKLDLLKSTLLAIKKHLQPKANYDEVRASRKQWRNVGAFLRDLPGDLRKQFEKFFTGRGYDVPSKPREQA